MRFDGAQGIGAGDDDAAIGNVGVFGKTRFGGVGSITAASSAGRRRGAPASAPGDAAGRDAAPGDAPGGDTASADPVDPAMDLDPAMVNAQAQAEVLRAAAAAHIPFCEECERTGTIA